MDKQTAIQQLQQSLSQIAGLSQIRYGSQEFEKWKRDTRVLLEQIFGHGSTQVEEFTSVGYGVHFLYLPTAEQDSQIAYREGLHHVKPLLESMLHEIELYSEEPVSLPIDNGRTFWDIIHPKIRGVAQSRYESQHFADAVEAALKLVNAEVKAIVLQKDGREIDGAGLMTTAFSVSNPILKLGDLSTDTGRSLQQGYMQIFAGSMTGIRNPKAHDNLSIDSVRAIHLIFLASLLMFKVDEATS